MLPNPGASSLGGIESLAATSHQWINSISTAGVPSSSQPAFTDISGTLGIGAGGTNATTAANALINLFPAASEVGDIVYCSAYSSGCTAWSILAGNTSGTKVLQETSSGVPSWVAGGGGSGTVNNCSVSTGAISYYSSSGTTVSCDANIQDLGSGELSLGIAGTQAGSLRFTNATSGSITLNPATGALGSPAITIPDASGTMALAGSLTANGMAYATSSTTVASTAAATNGQILIGSTSATPVLSALTAGGGITITNGAGSITIAHASNTYFLTQVVKSGSSGLAGANQEWLQALYTPDPVTFGHVYFNVGTLDASNNYSIGIYDSNGNTICTITAASYSSTGDKSVACTQGTVTLPAGKFYEMFTGAATTLKIGDIGSTVQSIYQNNDFGTSSGGAVPTGGPAFTPPSDSVSSTGPMMLISLGP
jgi:hypothetical protein